MTSAPVKYVELSRWYYVLLLLVSGVGFYYGFASYALTNNNESLYAEVAREMLVTGNYLIPHLNFLPYIEKPPLLYWLLAQSFHLLGVSTFAARLIPATSGLLVCISVAGFGRYIQQQRAAWLAALMLASSFGFQIIAREVFFDMLLTLCMTCSLMAFYVWYQHGSRFALRSAYFFAALIVLTKGLVGIVIAGGIVLAFLMLTQTSRRKFLQFFDLGGIGIFLLVALPWHLLAAHAHPGFLWHYFVNEQYLRFLNQRFPHDYYTGPFYYYLPRIMIYLLPWSLLLPAVLWLKRHVSIRHDPLLLFLWLWFLIPLLFFSLSEAKANYYMIVGTPPLALLLSFQIQNWIDQKRSLPFWILLGAALCVAGGVFASCEWWLRKFIPIFYDQLLPLMYVMAGWVLFYAIASLVICYRYRAQPMAPFFLIIGFALSITALLLQGAQRIAPYLSTASLANYVTQLPLPSPFYLYQDFENMASLLFYTQQPVTIIDSQSNDLEYGAKFAPKNTAFISSTQLQARIKKHPVYIAVLRGKLPSLKNAMPATHFYVQLEVGNVLLLSTRARIKTALSDHTVARQQEM